MTPRREATNLRLSVDPWWRVWVRIVAPSGASWVAHRQVQAADGAEAVRTARALLQPDGRVAGEPRVKRSAPPASLIAGFSFGSTKQQAEAERLFGGAVG